MKLRKLTATSLVLLLTFAFSTSATAQSLKKAFGEDSKKQEKDKPKAITVDAGGFEFKVPPPSGLVPLKKELKTFASNMAKHAANNNIHEIYAAKGSTEKSFLKNGLHRNCDVQTIKALDKQELDEKTFKQVKSLFNRQFETMMAQLLKKMKDKTGITMKAKEKVGSGAFIDEDSQYAYLFYSQVANSEGSTDRVSAACMYFLDGKILLANIHSNLESEKDAEWVKKTAKEWLKAIAKANE